MQQTVSKKTGGGRATKSKTQGWIQYELWNTCCILCVQRQEWVSESEMRRRGLGGGGKGAFNDCF